MSTMDSDKSTGLYTGATENTYKSRPQILSETLPYQKPTYLIDPNIPPDSYEYWKDRVVQDQERYLETEGIDKCGEIEFNTDKPHTICLIGDLHSGSGNCNYNLLHKHFSIIKEHPMVSAVGLGDFTDSIFFGRGMHEQIENIDNQYRYIYSALEWTGPEKWLAFWKGQHDRFKGDESRVSIYHECHKRFGAYYFEGPSVLKVKMGTQEYVLVGNHNWRGNSMYNDTHAENRASKFGIQGADVYFGGDTHKKGISTQVAKTVEGDKFQYFLNVGPYQNTSEYGRYQGFEANSGSDDSLGALWVTLFPDRHSVVVHKTSDEMLEFMKHYL